LYISFENERTDFFACDFAIDFDYLNRPNHLRMPLWAFWNLESLTYTKQFTLDDIKHRKDCCMVVSNANAKERIRFYEKLKEHIHIDMGGKYLNNVGGPVEDKMEFIKNYKFVISFENSSHPGYSTEKLIEPMLCNTIPIYWGDSTVDKDFNINSFINLHQYQTEDEAINEIVHLILNSDEYVNKLNQPWFNQNINPTLEYHFKLENILLICVDTLKNTIPVSKSQKRYLHWFNLKCATLHSLTKTFLRNITNEKTQKT
jgi:hypothetical protein